MKGVVLGFLFSVIIAAQAVFSCGIEESSVVTTDPVIYQQSGVDTIEPTPEAAPEAGEARAEAPAGVGAGAQIVVTDKMKVFIIPVSYVLPVPLMGGKLSVGAGIPYVQKTLTNNFNANEKKSGIGDISLKVTHDYGDEVYFRRIITLIAKLPTGDEYATLSDASGFIPATAAPLGSGSLDWALALSAVKRAGALRLLGNFGYRLNGDFKDTKNNQTVKYGSIINILAGAEYKINPNLYPLLYIRMVKKAEGETQAWWGTSMNQDDYTAIDAIVGARYKISGGVSVSGTVELPVSRTYHSGVTAPPNKVTAAVKANYNF